MVMVHISHFNSRAISSPTLMCGLSDKQTHTVQVGIIVVPQIEGYGSVCIGCFLDTHIFSQSAYRSNGNSTLTVSSCLVSFNIDWLPVQVVSCLLIAVKPVTVTHISIAKLVFHLAPIKVSHVAVLY